MWRWISWAAKLAASAILLSFLCIWTTGYIVNSYLQTVIKQLEIPMDVQPFALSGVWGTLWGADKPPKEEAAESTSPSPTPDEADSPDSGTEGGLPSVPTLGEDSASPDPSESPDAHGSVPDPEQGAETSEGTENGTDGENAAGGEAVEGEEPVDGDNPVAGGKAVNEGEALPVWDNGAGGLGSALTTEDRQRLYSLVVSKLNSEQLQQLSSYLEGGVEEQELPQLQALLQGSLNEQEYEQMMGIIQGQSAPLKQ